MPDHALLQLALDRQQEILLAARMEDWLRQTEPVQDRRRLAFAWRSRLAIRRRLAAWVGPFAARPVREATPALQAAGAPTV